MSSDTMGRAQLVVLLAILDSLKFAQAPQQPQPAQAPPVDQGKIAMARAKEAGDKLRAETEISKAKIATFSPSN